MAFQSTHFIYCAFISTCFRRIKYSYPLSIERHVTRCFCQVLRLHLHHKRKIVCNGPVEPNSHMKFKPNNDGIRLPSTSANTRADLNLPSVLSSPSHRRPILPNTTQDTSNPSIRRSQATSSSNNVQQRCLEHFPTWQIQNEFYISCLKYCSTPLDFHPTYNSHADVLKPSDNMPRSVHHFDLKYISKGLADRCCNSTHWAKDTLQ